MYEMPKWLVYWIVYASFGTIEHWRYVFTRSLPFYWLVKCMFLIWLMFSEQTSWIYRQLMRCLMFTIGRLKTKRISFIINPPDENVELQIKNVGNTKDNIHRRCDSQGVVNLHSLEDGNYEIEAYSLTTVPLLLLHKFQIRIANATVDVGAVDLKVTTLHVTFKKSDKPFDAAQIQGQFTSSLGGKCNLTGRTNSAGIITIPLPEGVIASFIAEKDQIKVPKQGNVTIPSPSSTPATVPRQPKYIIIDLDSSSFSSSVNPTEKNARVVVLGDISGSMSKGNQMDILKRSFQEIFEKCMKNQWNVSLASWENKIEWCTETWIQSSQTTSVTSWIQRQQPRGSNDMRNAIEDCMKRYPDATDVYVMCDGDITPFVASVGGGIELGGGTENWSSYRNRFPKTKFHFIALGAGASIGPMESMATTGGGIFTHAT
ncbi:unnamed protein product [Adineta steineri]|uniref:VWFA domain-containing protein n=2 Tax=Adineta steineri TaxID=433720 RepID=A0A815S9R5_9BILA|nr:unnamed protein product [Adineta steineri]